MKRGVTHEEDGLTLLAFLEKHLKADVSKRQLKAAIDRGATHLNGVSERFSSKRLTRGDCVEFNRTFLVKKEKLKLKTLFEDEHLIIFDKPSGMTSTEKNFQAYLTHRLDKETSGVIVCAKTERTKSLMEALFRKREVEKEYLALVHGVVAKDSGKIESYFEKKASWQGQTCWGSTPHKTRTKAITSWKCLKRYSNRSLLQLFPLTGRTHQLRVHMSEMGHPILGDHQYGRKVAMQKDITRLMLHASKITFLHPVTEKQISVVAKTKLFA